MSLAVAEMEAQEQDVNQEMRLCVKCARRLNVSEAESADSWQETSSGFREYTTIWHCGCDEIAPEHCVRCNDDIGDVAPPVCEGCLIEYRDQIREEAEEMNCDQCGTPIPRGEIDEYYESGLCGWCIHMRDKDDPFDRAREPEDEAWNPESELIKASSRIITPQEFRTGLSSQRLDYRLVRYLDQHPEKILSMSPREFEELVAALLDSFGYKVRLGPNGRDGGVDVYAERDLDVGPELVLVQCKRYLKGKKVDQPTVKLLNADIYDRRASRGLLVTTSSFTSAALKYIEESQYRLAGADYEKLLGWLKQLRRGTRRGDGREWRRAQM